MRGGERVGATFLFTCQGSNSIRSVREKAKNRWKVASVTHMNEEGGSGKLPAHFKAGASIVHPVCAGNLPTGVGD